LDASPSGDVDRSRAHSTCSPQKNALLIPLPDGADEKIEVLRSYGPLPYYERYMAGDHRQVWLELIALGASVRNDQYAADALAVAYATMSRIARNIGTIIERLREIGYEFEADSGVRENAIPFGVARWNLWMNTGVRERPAPLMPPERRSADMIRLEQDAGQLPISLRAWFQVVGSVTLLGRASETSRVLTCSGRMPTGITRLRSRHGSMVRSRSRRIHGSRVGPGRGEPRQLLPLCR
jgi:hypothetical protein